MRTSLSVTGAGTSTTRVAFRATRFRWSSRTDRNTDDIRTSGRLEDRVRVPLEGLALWPVRGSSRQRDHRARPRVELLAVAELRPEPGADQPVVQPVLSTLGHWPGSSPGLRGLAAVVGDPRAHLLQAGHAVGVADFGGRLKKGDSALFAFVVDERTERRVDTLQDCSALLNGVRPRRRRTGTASAGTAAHANRQRLRADVVVPGTLVDAVVGGPVIAEIVRLPVRGNDLGAFAPDDVPEIVRRARVR